MSNEQDKNKSNPQNENRKDYNKDADQKKGDSNPQTAKIGDPDSADKSAPKADGSASSTEQKKV